MFTKYMYTECSSFFSVYVCMYIYKDYTDEHLAYLS